MNRRTRAILDEAGVTAKYGVPPASIPDYLALVGDTADGYPGLAGWGAKSTARCSRSSAISNRSLPIRVSGA
jgi:5'-3' exonuclease